MGTLSGASGRRPLRRHPNDRPASFVHWSPLPKLHESRSAPAEKGQKNPGQFRQNATVCPTPGSSLWLCLPLRTRLSLPRSTLTCGRRAIAVLRLHHPAGGIVGVVGLTTTRAHHLGDPSREIALVDPGDAVECPTSFVHRRVVISVSSPRRDACPRESPRLLALLRSPVHQRLSDRGSLLLNMRLGALSVHDSKPATVWRQVASQRQSSSIPPEGQSCEKG